MLSVNPSLPYSMTYLYGRSKFEIENFEILIAYSDSSQKSTNTNCFYFFLINTGTCFKIEKTIRIKGKLNLPSILTVFA